MLLTPCAADFRGVPVTAFLAYRIAVDGQGFT